MSIWNTIISKKTGKVARGWKGAAFPNRAMAVREFLKEGGRLKNVRIVDAGSWAGIKRLQKYGIKKKRRLR